MFRDLVEATAWSSGENVDRWLAVVVGGIPSLYLVLEECGAPSDVLGSFLSPLEQ